MYVRYTFPGIIHYEYLIVKVYNENTIHTRKIIFRYLKLGRPPSAYREHAARY